jgi:hypothetical protein
VDAAAPMPAPMAGGGGRLTELEAEVTALKEALGALRAEFETFKGQF